MNLSKANILLTGAAGGIGWMTARELGRAGAKLLLTDVQAHPLSHLTAELCAQGITAEYVEANIADEADRNLLVERALRRRVNTLINIAGINPFGWLSEQSAAQIERVFQINTIAPVLLCRLMLPVLEKADSAHIVNVGSAFGAIGFPGFTAYSASKFAVRGFSEALRRELADTSIRVHYVAPRATRTALVTDRVHAMNVALGVAMDPPEAVARAIVKALQRERRELAIGFPERLFAKLNGLIPALVDRALGKQLATIRHYASATQAISRDAARRPTTVNSLQEKLQ